LVFQQPGGCYWNITMAEWGAILLGVAGILLAATGLIMEAGGVVSIVSYALRRRLPNPLALCGWGAVICLGGLLLVTIAVALSP
jgi:hypothetical protein